MTFTPQYPLWSDGAEKRRWLSLPPGSSIDASRPDAWEFPRGTRLWKEFALDGRPVETRFIERRRDGSWRFATYVWNAAGQRRGARARGRHRRAAGARGAGRSLRGPVAQDDCMACHGGAAVPVLGFGALQLSPERDPLAPGARPPRRERRRPAQPRGTRLAAQPCRLRCWPQPPRIAAATPVERAALGYLHGNCSHCHNSTGLQAPVRLTLAQRVADPAASRSEVLDSAVAAPSRYRPPGTTGDAQVVVPGDAQASVLAMRMQSRNPHVQMPPLGTREPDPEGLALLHRWITQDLPNRKEPRP